MERNIVRLHVLLLLTFSTFIVLPAVTEPGQDDPAQLAARAAIAAINLLVVVDLIRAGERPRHLAILTLPVALVWSLELHAVPGDVSAALAVTGFSLSAARLLRRPWAVAALAVVGVPYICIRVLAGASPWTTTDDYLLGTAMSLAAIAFVEALEIAIRRAAEVDARLAAQQSALHRQWSEKRAATAAGRVLHDDVLVALRMLQEPDSDRADVVDACRRAVHSVQTLADAGTLTAVGTQLDPMGSSDEHAGIADLVERMTADAPIPVVLDVADASPTSTVDRQRRAVVRRAVLEAVRNAARHSGEAEVTMRVVGYEDRLKVEIVDRGSGRPETFVPGYGIRHSIFDPVEEIGGRVKFRTTEGGGTTVRIEVPRELPPARADLSRSFDLTQRATRGSLPLRTIVWPVGLAWGYLSVRYSMAWPEPWKSLLLAAACALTTILLGRRMEQRAPAAELVVLVTALLALLTILGLTVAPVGALLDYRSWFIGWVGVPMMLLVILLPRRIGALVIASQVVVVLAGWVLRPELSGGALPLGSINAVVTAPMATLVLGHFLRKIGAEIEREEVEIEQTSLDLAMSRSLATVASLHLDHTRRVVVPWLRSIVENESAWDRRSLATQAALFASEVRDDRGSIQAASQVAGGVLERDGRSRPFPRPAISWRSRPGSPRRLRRT